MKPRCQLRALAVLVLGLSSSVNAGTEPGSDLVDLESPAVLASTRRESTSVTVVLPRAGHEISKWELYEDRIEPGCMIRHGLLVSGPQLLSLNRPSENGASDILFLLLLKDSKDTIVGARTTRLRCAAEESPIKTYGNLFSILLGCLLTLSAQYIGPELARRADALKVRMHFKGVINQALTTSLSALRNQWDGTDRSWSPSTLQEIKEQWLRGQGPAVRKQLRKEVVSFLEIHERWKQAESQTGDKTTLDQMARRHRI